MSLKATKALQRLQKRILQDKQEKNHNYNKNL